MTSTPARCSTSSPTPTDANAQPPGTSCSSRTSGPSCIPPPPSPVSPPGAVRRSWPTSRWVGRAARRSPPTPPNLSPSPWASHPVTAKQLITDALELRHRLPETWKRVAALEVPAWKGRHVAVLTHTLSLEAAGWVDQQIAPRLTRCGAKAVDTVVAHAIAKYDPDRHAEREARARKQIWDVTLHTPTASEYAATSELHITGDTLFLSDVYQHVRRGAAAAKDAVTTARSASAKSRLSPLCSPVVKQRPSPVVEQRAKRAISRDPHPQTVLYLHLDKTDLDDDTGPCRPGRAPRPGVHREDPRVARQLHRPHPARHPDGRRRRRQRPRPTRPDPRPGRSPRSDLPLPGMPGRQPALRSRPRHPLRPDRSTRPNQTLQPRPALQETPQRQDHRSLALHPRAFGCLRVDRAAQAAGVPGDRLISPVSLGARQRDASRARVARAPRRRTGRSTTGPFGTPRRRRRIEACPCRAQLAGKLLQLVDAPGDLGLLLVEQPLDAVVCGRAVRATPHGEQLGDLLAAQADLRARCTNCRRVAASSS